MMLVLTSHSVVLALHVDSRRARRRRVAWSSEHEALYGRYLKVEALVGAIVLVAVFAMVAKPGV